MAKPKKTEHEELIEQLETIQRLLIALLAVEGMTQQELAGVLQVSQSSVSRMFPSGLPGASSTKRRNPRRER